jgi:hypothetical protein
MVTRARRLRKSSATVNVAISAQREVKATKEWSTTISTMRVIKFPVPVPKYVEKRKVR